MSVPLDELTRPDKVTVNSHHGLEVSFAGDNSAAAHETTQRAFLDISGQRFAFRHCARTAVVGSTAGFASVVVAWIRGVGLGRVIRNLRFLVGVVVLFLIFGILSYPEHFIPP
jgi:hypothetical protein